MKVTIYIILRLEVPPTSVSYCEIANFDFGQNVLALVTES